ncbi:TPA: hypothetical protein ACH3X1_006454 [Trebouxia sp. C0004]
MSKSSNRLTQQPIMYSTRTTRTCGTEWSTSSRSQVQQIKAGGGGGDSSQLSIDSYRDSSKLSKGHNKALQRLLVLAIIMCGIPFACFEQPTMKHLLDCMRPSFDFPGIVLLSLLVLPL